MSKFWIDFQGYCCVDANSKEEAEEIFWDNITPPVNPLYDINYQVDTVEEEKKGNDPDICEVSAS